MFAETLGGIALVKSAVDGIKGAIGTAKDVGEIADFLDQLFVGQQQIQKKKIKKQNDPFSVDSVARETIDAKLAAEQMYEVQQLVNLRFGHGTWQSIINERAKRLREHQEQEKQQRLAREKQQEALMIGVSVVLELLIATGVFAFLYIKYL